MLLVSAIPERLIQVDNALYLVETVGYLGKLGKE